MNITHLDDLTYDYTQIADPNARLLAKLAAQDIKPRLRRAAADIIAIGGKLATVREHIDHGQWLPWLETEFDMAERTARNFVQVARRFDGKSAIIADLGPTALYMLAAPSTPDEAIAEVESHLANGYTPTVAETKQIITTVRAGLVPAPVAPAPAPGKLLVDWTDEDWAAAKEKEGGHKATPQQVHTQTGPRPYYEATPQQRQSDDKNDLSAQQKPAPLPADEGREWNRIQGLHGALSQMFILLTGEHRTTAEAYGFGVEYQRLLGEVESLRKEVKDLAPSDKMTG